jgi:hypothetical protein
MLFTYWTRIKRSLLIAAPVLTILLTHSAKAAVLGGNASIPFSFRVGANELPAGSYRLERFYDSAFVYTLIHVKTGKRVMIRVSPNNGLKPTQLFFSKDHNLERAY